MPQYSADITATQTDTILVPAPGAGNQIFVESVFASSGAAILITVATDGLVAVKEVATVDRGTSTGGTFTLTVGTGTTAAIAFGAIASAVKAALELLSTVTTVTVTGTGTVGDPWICTFDDPVKSLDVSGDGTLLTGGDKTLTVTETFDGLATGAARWKFNTAVNSSQGQAAGQGAYLFTCGDDEALTFTTSGTADVFISGQYHIGPISDLSG